MKLVFIGSGAFGLACLEALADSRHALSLVVSQPDRPAGRKKELTPCPAAAAARELGLALYQPEKINTRESRERLAREDANAFVVVSYGQILGRRLLALPPLGCINVHGSLLPRHRGASPVQGAILAGDAETGVTIMRMDEGLDTGPMLARQPTRIEEGETAGRLHDRLARLAAPLLLSSLDDVEAGRAREEPQDGARATLSPRICKEDGLLDWTRPAAELERRVRAFTPWPGAFTFCAPAGRARLRLLVEEAACASGAAGKPGEVLHAAGGDLVVRAGEGALRLVRVKPAGRSSLPIGEFLRGYPLREGDVLG